ncbi:MAG TPA: FHA domain-containing protein [Verrucomicrobiae bacterium]|nr:FHA domain-containing protein [Verrucomicrobiae bacterium]
MARLFVKTEGLENRTIELRLGANRIGRDPDCDFPIEHSTVSTIHCEIIVSADGVLLRDFNSTNGTFVNGDQISEAWLVPGQEVKLGDVELLVENVDVNVAIPQFERERPKPPTMTSSGAMLCPRHPNIQVTYKCTHCLEVMCSSCVKVMRIKGGRPLYLCPLCSNKCEPLQFLPTQKKKSLFTTLADTVKLKMKKTFSVSNTKK